MITRRAFLSLPLILVADDTAERNRIIKRLNSLGDDGVKLIIAINKRVNTIVSATGRDAEVQRMYLRLAEIYEEMSEQFRLLAN